MELDHGTFESSIPTVLVAEKEKVSVSAIAATYYKDASNMYPASETAQAAHVAILCRNNNQDPVTLMNALTRDWNMLANLVPTAAKVYEAREFILLDDDGYERPITTEDVAPQVIAQSVLAERLMILGNDELNHIAALSPLFMQDKSYGGHTLAEYALRDIAEEMIFFKQEQIKAGDLSSVSYPLTPTDW